MKRTHTIAHARINGRMARGVVAKVTAPDKLPQAFTVRHTPVAFAVRCLFGDFTAQ